MFGIGKKKEKKRKSKKSEWKEDKEALANARKAWRKWVDGQCSITDLLGGDDD